MSVFMIEMSGYDSPRATQKALKEGPKGCVDIALPLSTFAQERRLVSPPTPHRWGGGIVYQ